jgi:DnaJ-class molecular chaperone
LIASSRRRNKSADFCARSKLAPTRSMSVCAVCQQPAPYECSRCHAVHYCSAAHQREDWLAYHGDGECDAHAYYAEQAKKTAGAVDPPKRPREEGGAAGGTDDAPPPKIKVPFASDAKFRDYYALLEIPRDADRATLRKAYYRRNKELHPDMLNKRYGGGAVPAELVRENERELAEAQQAFNILSDATARKRYDVELQLFDEQQEYERRSKRLRDELARSRAEIDALFKGATTTTPSPPSRSSSSGAEMDVDSDGGGGGASFEAARRAEEARRAAAAEAQRKIEDAKRAAAGAQRKAEESKRAAAEALRKQEQEQAAAAAERQRKANEAAAAAAERQRKASEAATKPTPTPTAPMFSGFTVGLPTKEEAERSLRDVTATLECTLEEFLRGAVKTLRFKARRYRRDLGSGRLLGPPYVVDVVDVEQPVSVKPGWRGGGRERRLRRHGDEVLYATGRADDPYATLEGGVAIRLVERPHPHYRRDDADSATLRVDAPLSVVDALCGTSQLVTLHGDTVDLLVRDSTDAQRTKILFNGAVIRVGGRGMPRRAEDDSAVVGYGDLLVRVLTADSLGDAERVFYHNALTGGDAKRIDDVRRFTLNYGPASK